MTEGTWLVMSSNSREDPVPVNSLFVSIPENENCIFDIVRQHRVYSVQDFLHQTAVDVNILHCGEPCTLKVPSMYRQIKMTNYAPIHVAVVHSSQEVIDILVSEGADLNIQDGNGRTPLFIATAVGRSDVVKFLIEKEVDMNVQTSSMRTALMEAVCNNNVRIVDMLLRAGAEVNLSDIKGCTALTFAVTSRNPGTKIVDLLIQAGSDVNQCNKMGATALMSVMMVRGPQVAAIIKSLVQAGADVNKMDSSHMTAMHFAVQGRRNSGILALLLASGASLDMRDKKGDTPFDMAVQIPNRVAMEIFLRADCQRSFSILEVPKIQTMAPYVPEFMAWLMEELCNPRKLTRLCRQTIRQHVSPNNLAKLDSLDLPRTLQHFVTLQVLD